VTVLHASHHILSSAACMVDGPQPGREQASVAPLCLPGPLTQISCLRSFRFERNMHGV
jgi:hypothetical protein